MTTGADGFHLLTDLALILCVAAVTTVLFQRIKQPVILGYLLAGMIVGPHLPIPLFADEKVAHTLSELGVILLMFALGLEFRLSKLVRVAPTAGVVAIIQCSLLLLLGYVTGMAFGWTSLESLFTGAMIVSSSTTIIIKAFAEQRIAGKVSDLVFGILIFEDLIGIVLIAVLTTVGGGTGLSAASVLATVGKLAGFLLGLLAVGMLVVPRLIRVVVKLGRQETIVVASVGLSFGFALLALKFGYSVVLGAFLGGALVAESGEAKAVEKAIAPVCDVFAAVFFVAVGMLIDPGLLAAHWAAVLALTVVVVLGKLFGVIIGAFLAGFSIRTSVQAGMSLAQIGEFSFIIAGLGLSLGATRHFLYPAAICVSAITTLMTPWLIRGSGWFAAAIDRRLPRPIQTYATLYGTWVQNLRTTPRQPTAWSNARRLVAWLALDLAAVAGIAVGAKLVAPRARGFLFQLTGGGPLWGNVLLVALATLSLVPFFLGAIRISRRLAGLLALQAFPSSGAGTVDLAAAPRRALLVSIQIAILLVAGGPVVAVVQPFYPNVPGIILLLFLVIALVYPLWRSAANLQGHARAGAEAILELLASQSNGQSPASAEEQVRALLPGLGSASLVTVEAGWPVVGRSLKQIGLRGRSGATVIAIHRAPAETLYPDADETLQAGDLLVLVGNADGVESAKAILGGTSGGP